MGLRAGPVVVVVEEEEEEEEVVVALALEGLSRPTEVSRSDTKELCRFFFFSGVNFDC